LDNTKLVRRTKRFWQKKPLWLLIIAFFVVATPLAIYLTVVQSQLRAANAPVPLKLLSRNVPSYTNDDCNSVYPAKFANDADYNTAWRSCIATPTTKKPKWLAYNLSRTPAAQRNKALLVWYNDTTEDYNYHLSGGRPYNNLRNYFIETNTASGNRATPPENNWKTRAAIDGNRLHSRQHLINLDGANWIRIRITASDGIADNDDVRLNMDVYDASNGTADNWIFFGDALTAGAMNHEDLEGTHSFQQMIHDNNPRFFPVQENGGSSKSYVSSKEGAAHIASWLPMFPGKYVGLSYGTNDALACQNSATFYANYEKMVKAVLAVQKVPLIPRIPWGKAEKIQQCAPPLNAQIDKLYQQYPTIVRGPDLYTFFKSHPDLIAEDGIYLTPQGYGELRQRWVNTALTTIYANPQTSPQPTLEPQPTLASIPTLVPKPTIASSKPTPVPTTTPVPAPLPGLFSGLHVQGNQLLNTQNKPVILRGVNRAGTEYACAQGWGIFEGPTSEASVQAIASWNVNVVRIPLNEDCWLNINGISPTRGGATYQQAVSNYVTLLNRYKIYAIVELHWSAPGSIKALKQAPMPDKDHSVTFWREVATTFKNNPAVLFDLFNEPYPENNGNNTAAWQCWRDGGNSCGRTTYNGIPYQVAGMQELVNTVRSTGATNVILLGGLQYSNNLSRWLEFKPNDPAHNLGASWHIYPVGNMCNNTDCYDKQVAPVINSVPLTATEFGESFDSSACGVTNSNIVLDWLDAHNAGYVGWTWNTWGSSCSNLSLITNYNGTPKSPNGTSYKSRLSTFK
jgi:endoglucanase